MAAPVFMSLGSQYSFADALKEFWPFPQAARTQLRHFLESKYGGMALLTYKGRDAFEVVLKNLPQTDRHHIFLQGFACYALESAITRAGWEPGFVDIEPGTVNLSLASIQEAVTKYGLPAAVLIQHTFGVPAQMEDIRAWCNKNNVLLIADLAQSFGAVDETGAELGMAADVVLCSFGRDKVVDAVSGGAVIVRNAAAFTDFNHLQLPLVPLWVRMLDAVYPCLTWKIRALYEVGVGKVLHYCAKSVGLLQSPLYSPVKQPSALPTERARAVLRKLRQLPQLSQHRKAIAWEYFKALQAQPNVELLVTEADIDRGVLVRFPIAVPNPAPLLANLQQRGMHISDRWYRAAIDCSTLDCQSTYQPGTCPHAEALAQKAVQLPTHQGITKETARQLVAHIKDFYA